MSRPDPAQELAKLAGKGLLRSLRTMPAAGGVVEMSGRRTLNFSSNDYLDLASNSRLKRAACDAVERWGCSATASRLMSGHLEAHEALENRLARLTGHEAALVFGNGFLTNLGVMTALAGRGDAIFADRLNHASLVDGARLSGAELCRYRHCDTAHLQKLLTEHTGDGRRVIVSDSLFSMDGDVAQLKELSALAKRHGCLLVIDEAHAIGIFGDGGGGLCLSAGVKPDITVGTMSKSLGGYGGFAASSQDVRELLVNRARSFIYSTGLPPACLGSAGAALDVIEDGPDLGKELLGRATHLRDRLAAAGLDTGPSSSQIVPVMIGGNDEAVALSAALSDDGILAVAVRPPTVPAGTARLRLSVTLAHTEADLDETADRIAAAARREGVLE